jgi:hypothetical protein
VAMAWNTRSPMRDEYECRTCGRAFGRQREVEGVADPLPGGVEAGILRVRTDGRASIAYADEMRSNFRFFADREAFAASRPCGWLSREAESR